TNDESTVGNPSSTGEVANGGSLSNDLGVDDGGSGGSAGTGAGATGGSEDGGDTGGEPAECGDWACFPIPNAEAVPPLAADYDVSDPEVVFDRVTGLMWQTVAAAERIKADAFADACEVLTLAGHSDWRVPR